MSNFIKNKKLYVLNDDGSYIEFSTIANEVFLTADPIEGLFSFEDYYRAVTSPVSIRLVRLYLLNEDETIREDVTQYLIACTIDLRHTQGITHSSSITLLNNDKTWNPNPISKRLWKGAKFRIDIGLHHNSNVFWGKYGIFMVENVTSDDKNKTIQIQLYDKFAMFDGTIGGTIDREHKIPANTPIKTAIKSCLMAQKEDKGFYDNKPIIFPNSKTDIATPYTITKPPGATYGEIIIELANMISCDVYYNEDGHLVLLGNSDENSLTNRASIWNFDDNMQLYSNPNITYEFSKIVNKVSVFGAIIDGAICKGVATNTNAQSQTNIHLTPLNSEYIEDQNIYTDDLCLERAKYELQKKTLLSLQTNFDCVFIPSLKPNNLITWSNQDRGFLYKKFFINSVSFDAFSNGLMHVSLSNIDDAYIQ